MADRIGRQTPTKAVILPYTKTEGAKAIKLYNQSKNEALEWQEIMTYDLLAVDSKGLYIHQKFAYSIPRRNGKGEILTIRELYAVEKGEKVLHTAHRATTSTAAARRLAKLLKNCGYKEIQRPKETNPAKSFTYAKQRGLERIELLDTGGVVEFRTRTDTGGLGEGFDLLIIDEAQEYTLDQENTLKYTVSDSKNPQIIMCGTPPTAVSGGTVFVNLRTKVLAGETEETGWAEWSVEHQSDPRNIDLWYECNPSMGTVLTERKVRAEVGDDVIDFNIQRLGWWAEYNLQSVFTESEWDSMEVQQVPKLESKLFVGIKYSKNGGNVDLAICAKAESGKLFAETIDCRPITEGSDWIIAFLKNADWQDVIVDGDIGKNMLAKSMNDERMKKPMIPSTAEIISANAKFEEMISQGKILHGNQPSVKNAITNCQKRQIGSNGGFGFECVKDGIDTALVDGMMLATYLCSIAKTKKKQTASY